MSERYPRESCYICDFNKPDLLEKHHLVPQRFGGEEEGNVVHLCPSCHEALEKLYDTRFYDELGVEKQPDLPNGGECDYSGCKNRDTVQIQDNGFRVSVCEGHHTCAVKSCNRGGIAPIPLHDGGCSLHCEKHRRCFYGGCRSKDTALLDTDYGERIVCQHHAEEVGGA